MRKSGNNALPCSAGENEVSSGCYMVGTKPCPCRWTFFSYKEKAVSSLRRKQEILLLTETRKRSPHCVVGKSRVKTNLAQRERGPPGSCSTHKEHCSMRKGKCKNPYSLGKGHKPSWTHILTPLRSRGLFPLGQGQETPDQNQPQIWGWLCFRQAKRLYQETALPRDESNTQYEPVTPHHWREGKCVRRGPFWNTSIQGTKIWWGTRTLGKIMWHPWAYPMC